MRFWRPCTAPQCTAAIILSGADAGAGHSYAQVTLGFPRGTRAS